MIEIAVIGAGPAGLSAAINGRARNKDVTVFGRKIDTCALYKAERVNNYLGMPDMKGKEMAERFLNHAQSCGAHFVIGRVLQILPMEGFFSINCDNDLYEAKTLIITTGGQSKSMLKGEGDFLGKGVSYCATCDGMLYRGKDVVVVSDTEEGIEDANFLSEVCNNVYYVTQDKQELPLNDQIKLVHGKAKEIYGADVVEGIQLETQHIATQGVFLVKEATPPNTLVFGIKADENGILVDRQMATNIKGVFAAGDCTGRPWQVSKAVGEGHVAALSAVKYLASIKQE